MKKKKYKSQKEAQRKYNHSIKGKATRRLYKQSIKALKHINSISHFSNNLNRVLL